MPLVLATATGNSSVAVAVAVVATLILVGLVVALVSVIGAARALRRAAEELGEQSSRLLSELGGTVADAHVELERVDGLVEEAADLTETLSVASHAAYLTVASPLIKLLAFRRGTARAAQSWQSRHRDLRQPPRRAALAALGRRQPAPRQQPQRQPPAPSRSGGR